MNTIRRIFATALLLPALALAQTQENRATLYSEIATNLAAGQSGGITAAQLRQVCNDTVASTSNLSDSNASLSVTYTGTPTFPIRFKITPQSIYIPVIAGSGSPTTFSQSTASSFMAGFDYDESTVATAVISPPNAITSLTLNDLVSADDILIQFCLKITTLSFPLLQDASSIHLQNLNSLSTISLPNLIQTTFSPNSINGSGDLFITNCNSLVTISLPSLTTVAGGENNGGLVISSNSSLITLSAPLLSICGVFNPSSLPSLTTFSFPDLATVTGTFNPGTFSSLTTLSFPDLATVVVNFAPTTMGSLVAWSFPALTTIGGTFAPTTMGALTSLSCNALQTVGGAFSITSMASLTTASFPGMVTYGSTITINSGLGNLTSVTLGTNGTLKAINGATINISGQKLTSASVNAILSLLVSLDGTNGTTLWGSGKTLNISGGTSAAPSGQGVTDKATLVARGATITTN